MSIAVPLSTFSNLGFLSTKITFKIIPKIIATATDVIVITGLSGFPNFNVNPPIPLTKIADAIKMFF